MRTNMGKYYTPDLTEFHVRFRYERGRSDEWIKDEFEDDESVYDLLYANTVRVKYLDEVDIVELGWEKVFSSVSYEAVHEVIYRYRYFEDAGNVYELSTSKDFTMITAKGIDKEHNVTLFKGQLRNYNNLKTLMEWLKISK